MFVGIWDKANSVVLPSPVKVSTLWSLTSKVVRVFAIILPQNISWFVGATLNTILWLSSIAKPSVKVVELTFGFCNTLLIAIFNCVELLNLAAVPELYVILNFVLTPSNAALSVCEDPEPTDDKLIATLLAALDAFVANLNVEAVSKITKYAVPVVSPPIFPPPPLVYVTLCPWMKRWSTAVIVLLEVDTMVLADPSKVSV